MFDNSTMDSRESVSRIITMALGYKILDMIQMLESYREVKAWFEDGYIKFETKFYFAESFREKIEQLGGHQFRTTSSFSGLFKI